MPYAVVLYFEENQERAFFDIWKLLAKEHLSIDMVEAEIRPHITLAIYDELNCQPCDSQLSRLASQTRPLEFQISHLGLFTKPEPVVFAAPTLTPQLLKFHQQLHSALMADSKNPWKMYLPGQWVPHCTLALGFDLKNLGEIFKTCLQLKLPMAIKANQLGAVEFQPMVDLFQYRLYPD